MPRAVRDTFKTAFEVRMSAQAAAAADRGAFVDQSQSFNAHISATVASRLPELHMHTWSLGLKTGMYYLRTEPAVEAIAITNRPELVLELDPLPLGAAAAASASAAAPAAAAAAAPTGNDVAPLCRLDDPECASCGS